ncbi:MAG: 3-dehydroquinate synthase [Phycisphaerae bacterium]
MNGQPTTDTQTKDTQTKDTPTKDTHVQEPHQRPTIEIPAGEQSKSLEQLGKLYDFFATAGLDRNGTVIALGGGVVSDLAGFAAATWMRGVDFVICPTTLESDVDACLGGKTAINRPQGKNLVGAFHQPKLIVCDTECLSTLSDRDYNAALAESVKHALIRPSEFLDWHVAHAEAIRKRDPRVLADLIQQNLRTKAGFIENDPKESAGSRIMLNFGHTLGHGIEIAAKYQLRHGEAIALGLLAALKISELTGLLSEEVRMEVEPLMERLGLPTNLSQAAALAENPQAIRDIDFDTVSAAVKLDKKAAGGTPRFVLLSGVGQPVVVEDIPVEIIHNAFDSIR